MAKLRFDERWKSKSVALDIWKTLQSQWIRFSKNKRFDTIRSNTNSTVFSHCRSTGESPRALWCFKLNEYVTLNSGFGHLLLFRPNIRTTLVFCINFEVPWWVLHVSPGSICFWSITWFLLLMWPISVFITPFAVHYEKWIRIHFCDTATNSAKIRSLARKSEHLRINQIQ